MDKEVQNVCKNKENEAVPPTTPVMAAPTSLQEPYNNVIVGNNSNVMMTAPQNMLPINYMGPTLMQPIIINAPIILQPCNDYYYFVVPSQQ